MKTFVLTEDQEMLRSLAHDLARGEIRPRAEEVDHGPCTPLEGVKILAEAGLVCCMAPEAHGGAELGYQCQVLVLEETAMECASTAWAVAGTAEVADCLIKHGTPALQAAVLPLLTGGVLAASGEDSASVITEKSGRLSGRVTHVPNAGVCGWYLLPAESGGTTHWFLVEGDCPGLRSEAGRPMLGMKGCAMGTLVLEDCPAEVLEGDVADTLAAARALNMAAIAAGLARGALNEAITYVNQRVQFGKTIAQFENTQQVMADLLARAESARALVWDAAQVKDAGEEGSYTATLAKLVASDAACVITRKCVQFMGGYGYSREYPVERKMRDAKMTELYGGNNEALKALVAAIGV